MNKNRCNYKHSMKILCLYYFTPKLEIKPQLKAFTTLKLVDYFTPKLEIKPQPRQG